MAARLSGSRSVVRINLSGQQANTLLHDGQAWKEFPRTALSATRRAVRSARTAGATMFVHASFAFVHAVERGAKIDELLRLCVDAILECEALAMSGPLPACVVRLPSVEPRIAPTEAPARLNFQFFFMYQTIFKDFHRKPRSHKHIYANASRK